MRMGTGPPKTLVSSVEENRISRSVLAWLNTYGDLPAGPIRYENLLAGVPGMAMTQDRMTYVSKQYILGGHSARFHFNLVYRTQPGDSGNCRLLADEALCAIGDWACDPDNLLSLGEKCRAKKIDLRVRAGLVAAWENGDEDREISFVLTYEVL